MNNFDKSDSTVTELFFDQKHSFFFDKLLKILCYGNAAFIVDWSS